MKPQYVFLGLFLLLINVTNSFKLDAIKSDDLSIKEPGVIVSLHHLIANLQDDNDEREARQGLFWECPKCGSINERTTTKCNCGQYTPFRFENV